jgi:organic radical activating enzyme
LKFKVEDVIRRINKLLLTLNVKPSTVSITGGEPLLYADFLSKLLPALKKNGFRIYLETNGTLPQEFKKIKRYTDVVAMDIKLPSACGTKFWNESREFLKLAGRKAFVKVVADSKTKKEEIGKASQLAASVSRSIPFVIQPSTPASGCPSAKPGNIYLFRSIANKKLRKVFVIPQLHKIWNVR